MLTRDSLDRLIDECGLSDQKQAILDLVLPSIRLYSEPVEDEAEIPIGASKLGGQPDLPGGMEFPGYRGRAFNFVAQINLGEIARYNVSRDLPSSGLLQFFYGIDFTPEAHAADDVYHWVVLLHEVDPTDLRRTPIPNSNPYARFKPCRVKYSVELTIPPVDSFAVIKTLRIDYLSDTPAAEGYLCLAGEIEHLEPRRIFNRMLGYADAIQGDVFQEVDIEAKGKVTNESHTQDWILLLQIDSDDYAEMNWGDVGMLYYCIRREDLIAQRFDRITCIMQEN